MSDMPPETPRPYTVASAVDEIIAWTKTDMGIHGTVYGIVSDLVEDELATARDTIARLEALVKSLEWSGGDCEDDGLPWYPCCPSCCAVSPDAEYIPAQGANPSGKHYPGCALAASTPPTGTPPAGK